MNKPIFSIMISQYEIIFRLLLASLLGGLVGYEREKKHRPAGLRTHMLVCLGSTLITICGLYGFPGSDTSRLSAAIIGGIGFLGAGTIIASRGHIAGLTTAASVWAIGGIGISVGVGFYLASILSAVLMLLILKLKDIEKQTFIHRFR